MERLQKILSGAGVASRRASEDLIKAGRVTVDGKVATLGDSAERTSDIRVNGQSIDTARALTSYLLYKPRGIVTSASDERGRETVLEHMPRVPGLHHVGRLDLESEGLLLLTNDGELTLEMTHPRYTHEKEYRVWTRHELEDGDLKALEKGIELEDGFTLPAQTERARGGLFITLREGRNRQIRKMLESLGHRVSQLVRVRFGGLFLGDLEPGEYVELQAEDLERLKHPERIGRRELEKMRDEMYARWD